jgi:hypothetical protein
MPVDYFPKDISTAMMRFRQQTLSASAQRTMADFPLRAEPATWPAPWRPVAVQFYRNWLAYLQGVKKVESNATRAELRR